jgi:hypothetical protein
MPAPTNLARTQPWEHVPVEVVDMRLESRNRARAREGGSLPSTGAHLGNGHDESSRAVETTGGEGQKGIGGQAAVRTVGTDLGAARTAPIEAVASGEVPVRAGLRFDRSPVGHDCTPRVHVIRVAGGLAAGCRSLRGTGARHAIGWSCG